MTTLRSLCIGLCLCLAANGLQAAGHTGWVPLGLSPGAFSAWASGFNSGPGGFRLGPEALLKSGGATIEVPGYSVPSLADWNNDGLPDLIVGEGGGGETARVRVYLNTGVSGAPRLDGFVYVQSQGADLTVPEFGCQGAFPRVAYWDADTRKDLIVGLTDGTVKLFLNSGTDEAPTFDAGSLIQVGDPGSKVALDVGDRATPVVTDWNDDGRKDLLIGAYDGHVRVFVNEGTDTAPDFRTEALVQTPEGPLVVNTRRTSPAVADVIHDGRKELLIGETGGRLLLFANIGTDQAPVYEGPIPVTSEGAQIDLLSTRARPALGDWNDDGLPDVLLGSSDGLVRVYRNLGVMMSDGFELALTDQASSGHPPFGRP